MLNLFANKIIKRMQKTILVGLLFFMAWGLYGQAWMQLRQEPIQIAYKIPYNWFVGGLEKQADYWRTLNTAPKGHINMLLLYSEELKAEELGQKAVWNYHFVGLDSLPADSLQGDFGLWEKRGHWREDSLELVRSWAWKKGEQHYLLYLWGREEKMNAFAQKKLSKVLTSIVFLDD